MMKTQTSLLQISIQSPDLHFRSRSLLTDPKTTTLHHLKLSLFPPQLKPTSQTLDSLFFTFNGKPLLDSSTLLESHITKPSSTLILRVRARGGGGDGGATGAESRDCYLNMYRDKKPDKVDPNETRLSRWTTCALSSEPLKPPCVVDGLGNLFNKVAVVEGLLKKKLPKEFGRHIKGLKDLIPIHLSSDGDGDEFQCPISGLEFNGKYKFFALRGCGHVLSAKALKEVKSSGNCLVCHREYSEADDIIPINGTVEEVAVLREKMEAEREVSKKKKEKKMKGNGQLSGTKHGVDEKGDEAKVSVKSVVGNGKMGNVGVDVKGRVNNGGVKRMKSGVVVPANATEEVYASIFTSSKKSEFKETYSCRALPLGRN